MYDPSPVLNPSMLFLAQRAANERALIKSAIVPAGAQPGDPSQMGGAPPPDPAAAGGAGPDPSLGGAASPGGALPAPGGDQATQIAQQVMQLMGQGGGAPGAGGKAGGKKAEQQIIDTKLWIIQYMLVQIAQALNVKLPPSVVIGPPPDPMAMQSAQQDQQLAQGAGAPMPGDPSQMGGAPPTGDPSQGGAPAGPPPIAPMDASQGPIGKQATFPLDDFGIGIGQAYVGPDYGGSPDFNAIIHGSREVGWSAQRVRQAMGHGR